MLFLLSAVYKIFVRTKEIFKIHTLDFSVYGGKGVGISYSVINFNFIIHPTGNAENRGFFLFKNPAVIENRGGKPKNNYCKNCADDFIKKSVIAFNHNFLLSQALLFNSEALILILCSIGFHSTFLKIAATEIGI